MKRKGTAKWSILSKVMREAISHVASACPFLMQEPMLEPRLPDILANIKQRNPVCATILYSNLNHLPLENIKRILEHDLLDELRISFYGPTRELYKKYQSPLDYDKTVSNIKALWCLKKDMGKAKPFMLLHVLDVPDIMAELDGYKSILPFVNAMATVWFDTFHGDIPDLSGKPKPDVKRVPFQRLWTALNVHFDGNVVPCCIDYNDEVVLGNVENETLQEIWNGTKMQLFRRLHLDGKQNTISLCKNCRVHETQFSAEWNNYWSEKTLEQVCNV